MLNHLNNRTILAVSGEDRVNFLQGLTTIDLHKLKEDQIRFGAFLTAQGRIITSCFFIDTPDTVLIDCHAEEAERLASMLNFYRLKLKVSITKHDCSVVVASDLVKLEHCKTSFKDPRLSGLGFRAYLTKEEAANLPKNSSTSLQDIEFDNGVFDLPQSPLSPLLAYEANLDLLNGIDWDKGCYIGQEVTARIKYKSQDKKRVVPYELSPAKPSLTDPILRTINDVEMGVSLDLERCWALVKKEYIGKTAPVNSENIKASITFNHPSWMPLN